MGCKSRGIGQEVLGDLFTFTKSRLFECEAEARCGLGVVNDVETHDAKRHKVGPSMLLPLDLTFRLPTLRTISTFVHHPYNFSISLSSSTPRKGRQSTSSRRSDVNGSITSTASAGPRRLAGSRWERNIARSISALIARAASGQRVPRCAAQVSAWLRCAGRQQCPGQCS